MMGTYRDKMRDRASRASVKSAGSLLPKHAWGTCHVYIFRFPLFLQSALRVRALAGRQVVVGGLGNVGRPPNSVGGVAGGGRAGGGLGVDVGLEEGKGIADPGELDRGIDEGATDIDEEG